MNTVRNVRLSRRAALLGGLGVGAGLISGCQSQGPDVDPRNELALTKPPTSTAQPVTTDRKLAAGRYREVDLVLIRPEGVPPGPIPVCVALHDKVGGARSFLDLGVPDLLTELVRYNTVPFAIAAVDGGNWVGNKDDEPMRMLEEDLPGWLSYHDLATTPFAAVGVGEGAMGALNHARKSTGIEVVAAISPTLYEDWSYAQQTNDYENRAQWEAKEPLRHTREFNNVAVGVWCGTEDQAFLQTAKDFASQVGAKGHWAAGGHDAAYWKKVLPEALKFVGGHL
ncbi:alpha/beta hydrolase [Actinokineospora sp. NPDC004072]